MKILRSFIELSIFLILLTGCGNVLYLSKLGWHQAFITFHSIPIKDILEGEGIDKETKEKIRFVQEVKRHGEEKLSLKRTKSYLKYFELKGPILYVITASEKDRLQLHCWNFPIAGRVTYKSFFTLEGALKEKACLDKKGFDTFIQPAGAYSTLGWLKDPIFSSMLKWDEGILTNLILHEMAHATIYFKGQTDFNEQVATFIGNQGAIDFLSEKYWEGSKEVDEAIHLKEDDLVFSQWIDQSCRRLAHFYSEDISRDEKLKGREEIFRSIKEEFGKIKDRLKTDGYKDFEGIELNNAVLLAYRRYFHQLERFETLYESLGRNLKGFVDFFKRLKTSRDEAAIASFLD